MEIPFSEACAQTRGARHVHHTVMVPWFLLLTPLGGVVHACRQACARLHRLFVVVCFWCYAPRRWAMTDDRVSARALAREAGARAATWLCVSLVSVKSFINLYRG